jgi:FkbM family methyltransferase
MVPCDQASSCRCLRLGCWNLANYFARVGKLIGESDFAVDDLLMNAGFLRRAKIASQAFTDIANWREVLPSAAAGREVTEIRLRNGTILRAPPEVGLWSHFSDTWYHRSYTKYCAIPRDSVVVDIGANVGVFSLFAARFARVVYALEPASSNFERLVKNTSRVASIVPLNCACAAHDGRANLDVSGSPVAFSLKTSSTASTQETIDVISLATLFERSKIERCDFLKLDCEGAEFEIIWESDPALLKRIPRIVMEYHDHLSSQYSHVEMLEKLKSLGYRATCYMPNGTYGMIAAIRA